MKATILDGSIPGEAASPKILGALIDTLEAGGWAAEVFPLAQMTIAHCRGCFGCWLQTPGLCFLQDDGQKLSAAVIASDLTILFTPVSFGGYSSELKKGLDRLIGLISPFYEKIAGETHHQARYDRYPGLWGVGIQRSPDPEGRDIFVSLVERNALNFHAPGFAASLFAADQDRTTIQDALGTALAELGEKL